MPAAPAWAAELDVPAAGAGAVAPKADVPAWANELDAPATSAPAAQPHPHSSTRPGPHTAPPPDTGPEPSWGDTLHGAVENLIPSAEGTVKSMADAVMHPVRTVQTLGSIATGVGSQVAGMAGAHQDPAEKARTEALANALEDHYKQAYGSVKGFKKAVAADPVGVMMDASTVLSGGELAAAKVPGLAKVAALSGRAASAIDPVANAMRIAKLPGRALEKVPVIGPGLSTAISPSKIARGVSAVATGVPPELMEVAAKAGATTDPALRGAFWRFYSGQGDATEFLNAAQKAVSAVKDDASSDYLAKKATLSTEPVRFGKTYDAIADAQAALTKGSGAGWPEAKAALQAVQQMVDDVAKNPSTSARNIENADALKQQVWELKDRYGTTKADQVLNGVYHGLKADISDVDPAYANLMDQYQSRLNNITDLRKTLVGAGSNPSAITSMVKTLRAVKTGPGRNLFSQLAEKDPTLPYMIAGNALHPWGARGNAGFFEAAASAPAAITVGALAHNPVVGAATLAGQFAAQSPKIAGAANYAAGKGSTLLPGAGRALYYGDDSEPPGQTPGANPEHDAIWARMIGRESNGSQFDNTGALKVSPKGAVGIAQVEPYSGEEAAGYAGLPWDPERLKTDPQYNERLGHAYFEAMSQRFGSPVLGAAAYNAGPGAVEAALKYGDQWFQHLPAETRAYVRGVAGERTHFARGGAAKRDLEPLIGRLMAAMKRARKDEAGRTEPLLGASDEAVAKALKVAEAASLRGMP